MSSKYIQDFRSGDTFMKMIEMSITDTNTQEEKSIPMTGCKITFSMSEDFDSVPVISKTFSAGDYEGDNPSEGKVFIYLTDDETSVIEAGKYVWDVQITYADGATQTIMPSSEDYKDKIRILPGLSAIQS